MDATPDDVLLAGWHVVAGKLRADLVDPASERKCGCGSLEWLQSEGLRFGAWER